METENTTRLQELETSGFIVIPIKGVSMRPLLYTYKSHVMIEKLSGRPEINDVVLYVRDDGTQVLHRIISFDGDVALIRGDNTYSLERVPLEKIKGVAKSFWRSGKENSREISVSDRSYKLYVRFWNFSYPLRKLIFRAKCKLRSIAKRIIKKEN
ncbi:MAG: S24/S26 family peptidase [Oscillospiraceae bacterium]|nr:S24/S26 family peptidase [Ruminococcus sp.]MCD8345270.1 S24/S26 family peptidase [Oscillospiraceae bacterium]